MIVIQIEPARQDDVLELIAASDAYMASLYPAESNHMIDIDELERADFRLFVARDNGKLVGCGGWKKTGQDTAEIKRMFVSPSARGSGIGRRLLHAIEADALAAGIQLIQLETGVSQPEALGLYRRQGYHEREAFPPYAADPLSVFMERQLSDGKPNNP